MKKAILFSMMACACMFFSCTKVNDHDNHYNNNRVIRVRSDSKDSYSYYFRVNVGHRKTDCGGRCIQINGTSYHVDCQGIGHYCPLMSSVSLQQTGTDFIATTTDTFGFTSEDFFLMPDRSLNYTDENNNRIFLNIPEQMVYRDTATQQFTFTGLFFSNTAAYSND